MIVGPFHPSLAPNMRARTVSGVGPTMAREPGILIASAQWVWVERKNENSQALVWHEDLFQGLLPNDPEESPLPLGTAGTLQTAPLKIKMAIKQGRGYSLQPQELGRQRGVRGADAAISKAPYKAPFTESHTHVGSSRVPGGMLGPGF